MPNKITTTPDAKEIVDKINEIIDAQTSGGVTVDSALSTTSENPVQNKVITNELNNKQDELTAGTDISIAPAVGEDLTVSGTGSVALTGAAADSLNYVKLYGACEQTGTPTPTSPQNIKCNNGILKVNAQGQIYADGTTETVEDELDSTATAQNLLGIGSVKDEQEILTGAVTRKIGVKVFNGTEYWYQSPSLNYRFTYTSTFGAATLTPLYCTHAQGVSSATTDAGKCFISSSGFNFQTTISTASADAFKSWLADEYAAGHPVIIVYELATPTTESVTGQTLTTQVGSNTIEITQSSINNLPLEVNYSTPSDGQVIRFTNDTGYITGITSSDVTTALGYTPYNSTNPSGYITSTDYATSSQAGTVLPYSSYGTAIGSSGRLSLVKANDSQVTSKTNYYCPIVPANLDLAVKTGVTTNTITLTNAEQQNALDWLGAKQYIVSRGENLVTNGFASLGNNYNFSSWVFDGSDTYGAGGCFTKTSDSSGSRGSIVTSELMPVDITQSYKLTYAVKNTTTTATYDMISMYDIDGLLINKGNVDFVAGTTTTLAQDLKDGDTKVYLTNISSDWHTGDPSVSNNTYYRGLIFWNYQNSYGYTYPVGYYSRNWWYNIWNSDNDVDTVNGIITLKTAWNHGTFPAGTSVSQSTTSGGYVYGNANYSPTANEWTVKTATFTPDKFRNATSYVRLGWLYNYTQNPNNVFKISSISFTSNLPIGDALTTTSYATGSVGGVVKVGSAFGTNINNNGFVQTYKAANSDIDAKTHQYRPIVPYNLDYAVKVGVTTNTNTLTDAEKTAAQSWLGISSQESSSSRNIGEIVQSTIPLTDAGLHLLDGALLDACGGYGDFVDYIADLYEQADLGEMAYQNIFITESAWQTSVTNYGVCGKFVYNSTNNTVRLPKITGIIEGTTDTNALSDLVQAGLPNITGSFVSAQNGSTTPTGAFSVETLAAGFTGSNSNNSGRTVTFNASNSNSIYGNSNKVQPQTIKALYYIVVATTTKTEIEVDIDEVMTDLNGKADKDLTNCTDVANIKMAHNAMPSGLMNKLTLGASGSTYTAPADGYFYLSKTAGSDWYYAEIKALYSCGGYYQCGGYNAWNSTYRTSPIVLLLPVRKGMVCQVNYNATGSTNDFAFIYAHGSESEGS